MTRLEQFRTFMARMNPVENPLSAIGRGLYVPPPANNIATTLATRLELEPASTHLILGGVGSGKTTALMTATSRLREPLQAAGDHAEYIDVSEEHDIRRTNLSGVLTALAGHALVNKVRTLGLQKQDETLVEAVDALQKHAWGQWETADAEELEYAQLQESPQEGPSMTYRFGALHPPESRETPPRFSPLINALSRIRKFYPGDGKHAFFLFDSLDRMPNPRFFHWGIVHDINALKAAGIGVVVVGPVRFMVGADRAVADLFDETHFLPAHDPADRSELEFLKSVLRKRAGSTIYEDSLEPLAKGSGGMMRDLISLAKRAGQEAYTAGYEAVTPEHVVRAIEAFGRSLAIGLDDEQVKTLKHLQRGKGFVIRGERELSLIETGRVVLHGTTSFSVHPALAPLLGAVDEAA